MFFFFSHFLYLASMARCSFLRLSLVFLLQALMTFAMSFSPRSIFLSQARFLCWISLLKFNLSAILILISIFTNNPFHLFCQHLPSSWTVDFARQGPRITYASLIRCSFPFFGESFECSMSKTTKAWKFCASMNSKSSSCALRWFYNPLGFYTDMWHSSPRETSW